MEFSDKKKLLFILPSVARGGAEESALRVVSRLVDVGWNIDVAFPEKKKTRALVDDFRFVGAVYNIFPIDEFRYKRLRRLYHDVLNFFLTWKLIKKIRPNVCMIFLPWPIKCFGTIMCCAFFNLPTIVSFRLISSPPPFLSRYKKWIYRWAKKRNQKWITLSKDNQKLAAKLFDLPETEVDLVYNGIDFTQFEGLGSSGEKEEHRIKLCEQLNIPHDSRIVLTVANLAVRKGHQYLARAIPEIRKHFPNVFFLWVGDGSCGDKLAQQLSESGHLDRGFFWVINRMCSLFLLLQICLYFLHTLKVCRGLFWRLWHVLCR